jgi:hypothetical protein
MNTNAFWNIVDRVHASSPCDMDVKCRYLEIELRQLSVDEIYSFDWHFCDYWHRADTWDLWAAAVVICNGCGDDSFMDFRATLVSMGRAVFESGLADADSLAAFDIDPTWARYEGYQYVAPHVYGETVGRTIPHWKKHSNQTAGVPFNEWELSRRLPKLARKYGFKDSDWDGERVRAEKGAIKSEVVERVWRVMLTGGLIPPCGLIPPFNVTAPVLRAGRSPRSTGNNFSWDPIELDEEHYWSTVVRLEEMTPEERAIRLELQAIQLKQDFGSSCAKGFDDWMKSLEQRGLV